jgi:pyruvate formate lyase activating enzyme
MKAPINKIIDFSTVDGPGCRTSIFVQKCNIHCLYCHNPETQNLCINCGKCVSKCPKGALSFKDNKVVWNKDLCINCDTCINVCLNHASPKIMNLEASEVFKIINKNKPFIRGITVSGGECSLYPEFLEELFELCHKNNLTTLLDSNGMVKLEEHRKLMDLTDGVMLDIKSWNQNVYQKLVGFDNTIVKENLAYLNKVNKIEELRIVYVKGYVDAYNCIDGIKSVIGENVSNVRLKLITFRQNGVKGILKDYPSPTREEMQDLYNYATQQGFKNIVLR